MLRRIKTIRGLAIISLICILFCVLFELLVPGRRAELDSESIAKRISMLVASTETSSEKWCSSNGDDDFVERLWRMPELDEWVTNGVSYYLFCGDSMVFWNNHIYHDKNFDSIILAGGDGCVNIDSSSVLIFEQSDTVGHKAITVVKLYDSQTRANRAIFDRHNTEAIPCQCEGVSGLCAQSDDRQAFDVEGKHFSVLKPINERESNLTAVVGWFGVFVALLAFIFFFVSRTTNSNVLRQLTIVFLSLLSVRILEFYVDFPQGGSYSWTSLSSILISQLAIMLMLVYLYYVRWKVAYRIRHMSNWGRNTIFAIFTTLMCASIVFFHLAMVGIVFEHNITVELYSIFSMSLAGLEFYLICSVFAIYRIIYGFVLRSVFDGYKPWINIVVSEAILALMIVLFNDRMHDSGIYLLTMHLVFMIVSSIIKQASSARIFVISTIILTLYVCFFAAGETRAAKVEEAKRYVSELLINPHNPPQSAYKNFSHTIISENMILGNATNIINIDDLLPSDSNMSERVVMHDGLVCVIKATDGVIAIVSYHAANLIDLLSLICYIFLGLYIVAGISLRILGLNIFGHTSIRRLSNKIRYVVTIIVFCSMMVVMWITQAYSEDNYQSHQNDLLSGQIKSLLESFSKFTTDKNYGTGTNIAPDSILLHWYNSRGSAFTLDLCVYSKSGSKLIQNSIGDPKPTMIDYKVRQASASAKMPYMVRNEGVTSSAYASLFVAGKVVGFIRVTGNEQSYSPEKYVLLDNILNLFVVLLIFSVSISSGLYSLIAGPLKLLTESMNGIGRLQKIPINRRYSMNDEVGTLIMQYNRMVDYLDETYRNIARSERENAWREMARQVAHEIKNPLTPMRLKIQILQRARAQGMDDLDRRTEETLELLIEQIDVLSNIATAFSDMARLEQGETSRLELDSVLASIVALYRDNSAGLEIALRFENPSPLFVEASYTTLSRLFVNLLQNAMQALQCNGRIVVSLRQEGNMAVVDVADNGRGIEPELIERIFEPNFTTRSSGSGLGLAICRQIVATYRGTISVQSTPGNGAVFTVSLPIASAKSKFSTSEKTLNDHT